jgi:hypothetical protein
MIINMIFLIGFKKIVKEEKMIIYLNKNKMNKYRKLINPKKLELKA